MRSVRWVSFGFRHGVAALMLLLPLAGALRAQGPPFLRDTTIPGDPIQVLLDRGAELRLTPGQVGHLRGLQQQLHASNDSLVARLVAIRHEVRAAGQLPHPDMSDEQRAAFRSAVQRARPLMQAIGRNNYEAMQQVGAVLTEPQKEVVRTWLTHSQGNPDGLIPHGQGAGSPGAGRGRGPGAGGGRGPGRGGR